VSEGLPGINAFDIFISALLARDLDAVMEKNQARRGTWSLCRAAEIC
jgi:hypothetical protein